MRQHLRERKLTTQLTSPSTAHTCTITHIHERTLNFKRAPRLESTLAVDCGAAEEEALLLQPEKVFSFTFKSTFTNKEAVVSYSSYYQNSAETYLCYLNRQPFVKVLFISL